jgi:putative SOS response-associated peptidase YedK
MKSLIAVQASANVALRPGCRDITSGKNTATGKQPWYFTRADGEPLTVAGLWDEWKDKAMGSRSLARCLITVRITPTLRTD